MGNREDDVTYRAPGRETIRRSLGALSNDVLRSEGYWDDSSRLLGNSRERKQKAPTAREPFCIQRCWTEDRLEDSSRTLRG